MKTIINKEEQKKEWSLDHWYEKAVYIIGIIYVVLFSIGFIVGFIEGLAG